MAGTLIRLMLKMKKIILILISCFHVVSHGSVSVEVYEIHKQLEGILVEKLRRIKSNNEIPEYVLDDASKADEYHNFSIESQDWIENKLQILMYSEEVANLYRIIEITTGHDVLSVNAKLFVDFIKGNEIDIFPIAKKIRTHNLEWRNPAQNLTPLGRNPIIWIWSSEIEDRENGVLHVGIDVKTRHFICYENTVGIYYPEGERLEMIHSRIVQDPESYKLIEMHIKNHNDFNKEDDKEDN